MTDLLFVSSLAGLHLITLCVSLSCFMSGAGLVSGLVFITESLVTPSSAMLALGLYMNILCVLLTCAVLDAGLVSGLSSAKALMELTFVLVRTTQDQHHRHPWTR